MKVSKLLFIPILFSLVGCQENNNSSLNSIDNSSIVSILWKVNFYYNYEGNGDVFTSIEVGHHKLINEESVDIPSRDGYEFDKWYKDSYCKVEWDFANDKVTAPTSLYASWSKVNTELPQEFNINFIETEGVTYTSLDDKPLPSIAIKDQEISFKLNIKEGYIGTPVVLVNEEEIKANNDIYTFKVINHTEIKVEGISKEEELNYYRIKFTLPDFDPIATNPRLYYWGDETVSNTIFNFGAESNMTLLEGSTYYIDIDLSISLEGMIVIFDQGNEVKQSFDIIDNLPKEEGVYVINVPNWGPDGWKENSYQVWCFVATLVKE